MYTDSTTRARSAAILVLIATFFVFTGCAPVTTESPLPAPELGTPAELPETGNQPIPVTLTEFAIDMPATVPAGSIVFDIVNAGTMEHGFEIEGQGVEESLDPTLQPGETGTLEVNLEPGTYTVYCPVDDHRASGMEIELTVTESSDTGTPELGTPEGTPSAP